MDFFLGLELLLYFSKKSNTFARRELDSIYRLVSPSLEYLSSRNRRAIVSSLPYTRIYSNQNRIKGLKKFHFIRKKIEERVPSTRRNGTSKFLLLSRWCSRQTNTRSRWINGKVCNVCKRVFKRVTFRASDTYCLREIVTLCMERRLIARNDNYYDDDHDDTWRNCGDSRVCLNKSDGFICRDCTQGV